MNKTILILGGYGGLGLPVARLLLKYTKHTNLIIAGRNIEKAEKTADDLNKISDGERVKTKYADVANPETLESVFKNVDLVIVCSPTTDFTAHVAKAALDAGIDYMDTHYPQKIVKELNALSSEIKKKNRCFITQSGFHPGLPSALIRYGAQYFSEYKKAVVSIAIKEKHIGSADSAAEFITELGHYKSYLFKNKKWHTATYDDKINVDFGHGFGVKTCYPFQLEEMMSLPEKCKLEETGLYITGFNWFTDYVVFPLAMITNKIFKHGAVRLMTKLLLWGIDTFTKPPLGVVTKLEAEGISNGKFKKLNITLRHHDTYKFTAIPIVACLLQYLDGQIKKPGLWYMGHVAEPERLFKDMERMGVKIENRYVENGK